MSSIDSDLYGFLNLPPSTKNRPSLHQKRVISGSDKYPSSSLPVSSTKNFGATAPKRPAADVIGQVHRRLSGNNNAVNGSPSSIPLFRGSSNVLIGSNGQGSKLGNSLDNEDLQIPTPQPRQRADGLRNSQNLRTRASIIGDNNYAARTPENSVRQFSSNNPFRPSAATNEGFVNSKSRRRSIVVPSNNRRDTVLMNGDGVNGGIRNSRQYQSTSSTYAAAPSGTHPSISSRRPERLSVVPSNTGLKLPPNQNSIRKQSSRISLSPVPNGPRRVGESIPPVPTIPNQISLIGAVSNGNRISSLQPTTHRRTVPFLDPKRSFSNEITSNTRSNRGNISNSISMNSFPSHQLGGGNGDRTNNQLQKPIFASPQKPSAEKRASQTSTLSNDKMPEFSQLSQYHHQHQHSKTQTHEQPQQPIYVPHVHQAQIQPITRSQTLPDIARLELESPYNDSAPRNSPGPKHQLSAKSPYRPLNMPARIHPRPNDFNKNPSIDTPDLNPVPAQSKTAIGEYSIAKNTANTASVAAIVHTPQGVRSKSTASKQWSSPRSNGQASVAATRRMLLSPYENYRRISQIGPPESMTSYPPPPAELTYLDYKPMINISEIRSIMKNLNTSKSDVEESNRLIKELQAKGDLIVEPVSPAVASKTHHRLSIYEKGEILDFRHVYYCGQSATNKKIIGDVRRGAAGNFGFDDDKGDYRVTVGDHIGYRYRILGVLGKGSFGKVLKCIDHRSGKLVALKIIINRKRLHMQALIEADLLKSLSTWDPKDKHHMVRYLDHFNFREHLCITTELLGINLYELIKFNNYKGLPVPLIRHFTYQILEALAFLDSKSIIHCDLKPENVMLCDSETGKIKIIDFGSSCYESERVYTYIQSRFYRSPEVMLGMPYGRPVDIWSLGCIIPELVTGRPLFMGDNEQEQVACIMEVFGIPDKPLISKCARRRLFFDSLGKPRVVVTKRGEQKQPSSKRLHQVVKNDDPIFLDFLSQLLKWDPKKRPRPAQALQHEFIIGKSLGASSSSSTISTLSSTTSTINLKNSGSSNSISSIASSSSATTPTPSSTISSIAKASTRQIQRFTVGSGAAIASSSRKHSDSSIYSGPPSAYLRKG